MTATRAPSGAALAPVSITRALLRALELRDPMTARHCVAVAGWTREVAHAAGLSRGGCQLAHTAGLLHDIGKLAFPDRILKRDVRLTPADWDRIRTHPGEGARVLAGINGYEQVREIILAHHERVDGRGYPHGVPAAHVPAIARMIAVVDAYDAMTARDSYRPPVSPREAIAELRRVAGTQLDPAFVDLFVETRSRRGSGRFAPSARFTPVLRV
ncbi:MAG: HD-GYP domain-containing protein [Pseudonocardiaceae bacterium]